METPPTTSTAPSHLETEARETSAENRRVFSPREALDIDKLQELRGKQQEAYDFILSFQTEDTNEVNRQKLANEEIEKVTENYLSDQGLSKEDESYLLYKSVLGTLSISAIPETEWYAKLADVQPDDGTVLLGQSGIEKARAYYEKLTGKAYYEQSPAQDEDQGVEDTVEDDKPLTINGEVIYGSLEVHRGKLNDLRDKLAELSSKRQGRLMGTGKKYEAMLAQYNEQVILVGKLEHQALIEDEEASETTKKATVVGFLFQEQQLLREAAFKVLDKTVVSGFVEMMNKGSKFERFGKGVLLGLGAAGIAAVAAAAAGVAGAAVIGTGIGMSAFAAARFARGFARSDARNGRGMELLDVKHLERAQNAGYGDDGPVDYVKAVQEYYSKQLEHDTKAEQKKRQKSVMAGIGGVALGALGVGIIATAADNGAFDAFGGRSSGSASAHFDTNIIPQEGESIVPRGGNYGSNGYVDLDGDGLDDRKYGVGETPEAQTIAADAAEAAETAGATEAAPDPHFIVQKGEGGIHFFQDLGLTEADWYSMHLELISKFPQDFYFEGSDVRISHSGQLSIPAQELIKERFNLSLSPWTQREFDVAA